MATENKAMAAANEEMKSEFEIRQSHLDNREKTVTEKEKLHQDLDDKKIQLDQRELRQKLKEDQWVESVARANAAKNADLKQSNDLLQAQIESARVYEQDLRKAKVDLAQETKSRRVAMKKVQEVQEKFENLLKEKVRMREEQSDELRRHVYQISASASAASVRNLLLPTSPLFLTPTTQTSHATCFARRSTKRGVGDNRTTCIIITPVSVVASASDFRDRVPPLRPRGSRGGRG